MTDRTTSLRHRYVQDLDRLIDRGVEILDAAENAKLEQKYGWTLQYAPAFHDGYQPWYSEAQALVKHLLPDRLDDFVGHYKSSDPENHRLIANLLRGDHGLSVQTGLGHLRQQVAIIKAAKNRFDSSLYEIRQLLAADLFDSELDVATELLKKGFLQPAGVVAGVVLENHLKEICYHRQLSLGRKRPTLGNLNDLLKRHGVVDVPQFRQIQHLADLRNLCSHKGEREPKVEEIENLLAKVREMIKTLF